jgi:hypothetical protein
MRAFWRHVLHTCGACLLAGCGYVADPLPPALNIPAPVADLRAVQRGDQLVVEFTIPPITTDNLGLRVGGVELLLGALEPGAGEPGANIDALPGAERLALDAAQPGPVRKEVPISPWTGKAVGIAVRVASHKMRWSEWSNRAVMDVLAEVHPPIGLTAAPAPEGVRLHWSFDESRGGRKVRIWRKAPGEPAFVAAAEVDAVEWLDTAAQYGQTYEYAAEAVIGRAESLRTAPVAITPEDKFAPAPPAGLTAIAGVGGVELAWEPGQETDLAGYRVFRGEGPAKPQPLNSTVMTPSFRDVGTKSGNRYTYSVSALDRAGNESTPCAAVEVEVP